MSKFRLSKNIKVEDIEKHFDNVPDNYVNQYILVDEFREREFLINDTVKYFIDKFNVPKTKAEILSEVEIDVQSQNDEIKKTCSKFFTFLVKRKIIVKENENEFLVTNNSLFKANDPFENFKIVQVLSIRQYIDIYLVFEESTGEQYLIKLLNKAKTPGKKAYEEELMELECEFAMLERTKQNPYISKAFAFYKRNTYAYIIEEYINGKSLNRFLNDTLLLNEQEYLQIINQILEAFSLLHTGKIIHGDIHSSNILIDKARTVKVIDLGMSRNTESHNNEVLKFGGVDYYMPPERINLKSLHKYKSEPDLYSDVYQLGILLYFSLYKKMPFEGFIWEELARKIKEDEIQFPESSFLQLPVAAELMEIIKKCVHKEPMNRYRNATEILADFKQYYFEIKASKIN